MAEPHYYRCPNCDKVLDRRKYPEGKPCPYCAPEAEPGPERAYRGSKAREFEGVIRSARQISKPRFARDPIRIQGKHYASGVALAILLPTLLFVADSSYFSFRTANSFARVEYIGEHRDDILALKTVPEVRNAAWKDATHVVDLVQGGVLDEILGSRSNSLLGARVVAILTGLIAGGTLSWLYLRTLVSVKEAARLNAATFLLFIVLFAANLLAVQLFQSRANQAPIVFANEVDSMLNVLAYSAINQSNGPAAREHLQQGPDFGFTDFAGRTYLHLAAARGLDAVVDWLLISGLDANCRDQSLRTPLHNAAVTGSAEIVRILLEREADPSVTDDHGKTPLHLAAEKGDTALVKMLLDAGAARDTLDDDGQTPLLLAAYQGNGDAVSLLIEQGANVDARQKDGMTLAQAATGYIVEHLLGREDPVGAEVQDQFELLKSLQSRGANLNVSDELGVTLLHRMREAQERYEAGTPSRSFLDGIVTFLLDNGADRNLEDANGDAAYSIHHAARLGNIDVARRILAEDPQALSSVDETGAAPLEHAIRGGRTEMTAYLIEQGADVTLWSDPQQSALQEASARGFAEIVKQLLEHGVPVKGPGGQRSGPLLAASLRGDLATVEVLLEHGYPVNEKDQKGETPLHVAARANRAEVIGALLAHGADVNAWNNDGRTAAQVADDSGKPEIAQQIRLWPRE
ncbi:MAG: ankyrin repeat domain-containing protein [Candidatus Hydrogenedentota bacterium]